MVLLLYYDEEIIAVTDCASFMLRHTPDQDADLGCLCQDDIAYIASHFAISFLAEMFFDNISHITRMPPYISLTSAAEARPKRKARCAHHAITARDEDADTFDSAAARHTPVLKKLLSRQISRTSSRMLLPKPPTAHTPGGQKATDAY